MSLPDVPERVPASDPLLTGSPTGITGPATAYRGRPPGSSPREPLLRNHHDRFRDSTALGGTLIALSTALTLASLCTAATAPAAVTAYDQAIHAGKNPDTVTTTHDLLGWLVIIVEILTWIVASLWLATARRNAALIAPQRLRRSRRWVWLGWFVPPVSLWFPKQIVDDVWQITAESLDDDDHPTGGRRSTGWWWALWVTVCLLGDAEDLVSLVSGWNDPHRYVVAALEIPTAILTVPALVFWVSVVLGLTRTQAELVRRSSSPRSQPGVFGCSPRRQESHRSPPHESIPSPGVRDPSWRAPPAPVVADHSISGRPGGSVGGGVGE